MGILVLVRHGQSQWNLENRFAGWSDDPPLLTDRGRSDVRTCARFLEDFSFDIAFTSRLKRGSETLAILLRELHQETIPVVADSALNERHYGDLQGLNRAETAKKYGEEQVRLWRRSFATRPPNGESIEDCVKRVLPFFRQYVMPHVRAGKCVLMAIHGNSMRPIIKELDQIHDGEKVAQLEIGLCTPYIYWFENGEVTRKETREVPGIVTMGGSTTETTVREGRV